MTLWFPPNFPFLLPHPSSSNFLQPPHISKREDAQNRNVAIFIGEDQFRRNATLNKAVSHQWQCQIVYKGSMHIIFKFLRENYELCHLSSVVNNLMMCLWCIMVRHFALRTFLHSPCHAVNIFILFYSSKKYHSPLAWTFNITLYVNVHVCKFLIFHLMDMICFVTMYIFYSLMPELFGAYM